MATLLADIKSLVGSNSSEPAKVPAVGEPAPFIEGERYVDRPHLLAFVRHCGCPFAEKEVRQLAKVHAEQKGVKIVIVAHSSHDVAEDWFARIGKPHFDNLNDVELRSDPEYKLYNAFGIGQLGWTELITKETFGLLSSLATEGIKNTPTGEGSNRWLNSGGFAIDRDGVVRWAKVASEAADICDYEEAVRTIV